LERWFLKTLTNIAFGREYPVFKPQYEWRPSQELVEIAFGRKRFQPRAGLYLLGGQVGETVNVNEKFRIMTFTNNADELVGARFSMFGFMFALYLKEEGLNRDIFVFDASRHATSVKNVMYHPNAINYTTAPGQLLSHVLQIDWR
jgi:hypothetical protein